MKQLTFEEATELYDPAVGIEVHVELSTDSKVFDGAPVVFGAEPNTALQPVSAGLPGALPVLNEKVLESAIRLGLALNCDIAERTMFARKHYFYPDLPKAFQTSQGENPIAENGLVEVELEDGTIFEVGIERAHMEEDAGKNTHIGGAAGRIHGADHSLVDFNRSSVPLIEIVSRPILGAKERAGEVAATYVQTLRDIAKALGISDAQMERGNVRADINVSVSKDDTLGTRTETKNLNSFRSIARAVEYEVARQASLLEAGEKVVQETRHFNEDGTTSSGRPKTGAEDYRFFPDPDLPPIEPDPAWVAELAANLVELPTAKRRRLRETWGFSDLEMRDVVNAGALDLLEATVLAGAAPESARKWWMGELSRHAKREEISLEEAAITPTQVAELQALVDEGALTDRLARQVLEGVLAGEGNPREVVKARGLEIVSDDGALNTAVEKVIAENPDVAEKIRGGKLAAIGALVGGVMRETRGQADAKRVKEIIMETLGA